MRNITILLLLLLLLLLFALNELLTIRFGFLFNVILLRDKILINTITLDDLR